MYLVCQRILAPVRSQYKIKIVNSIQGGGTTSSNFSTNAFISFTAISQQLRKRQHYHCWRSRHTSIIMHHTNPHDPLLPQPQHILHQPITIERAPPEPKLAHPLHPLHDAPAPLSLDHETNRRHPKVRVRAQLPEDRNVLSRSQIRQENFLEGLLVRFYRGPGRGCGGGRGAEVGAHVRDGGCELVVGGCEAEFAF